MTASPSPLFIHAPKSVPIGTLISQNLHNFYSLTLGLVPIYVQLGIIAAVGTYIFGFMYLAFYKNL